VKEWKCKNRLSEYNSFSDGNYLLKPDIMQSTKNGIITSVW